MNYRDYKQFSSGQVYHVFNRGVAKQDIYLDNLDYELFLRRLKEQVLGLQPNLANRHSYQRKVFKPGTFTVLAYCLMPNHFHILIRQNTEIAVSDLFQRVISGYSKVFNMRYERVGSLFQDQYKAVRVDSDEYLAWVSAYIHLNPFTAGLIQNSKDWIWSSYPEYVSVRNGRLPDISIILSLPLFDNDPGRYQDFVENAGPIIRSNKDLQAQLLDFED